MRLLGKYPLNFYNLVNGVLYEKHVTRAMTLYKWMAPLSQKKKNDLDPEHNNKM